MLRPRVLASVLQEANENAPGGVSGDCCTLLLNREGALLAASSHQNTNQQPRVIAAIVSTVWSMASQNVTALDRDPLQILILDSSKARYNLSTCVNSSSETTQAFKFNWFLLNFPSSSEAFHQIIFIIFGRIRLRDRVNVGHRQY